MLVGYKYPTNGGSILTIIEYTNANHITVSFESGYTTVTSAGAIRSGGVKDKCNPTIFGVGYVGDGKHKPYYNSRTQSPAYTVWTGILERCYGPHQERDNPAYVGCIVDDEWHNFQTFAD